MKARYFIAGTDTDVGKTVVTQALLHKAKQQGLTTLGLKPIAAGAKLIDAQLYNDDALALQAQSTVELPYQQVNPVVYEEAVAPHLAAQALGKRTSAAQLTGFVRGALMQRVDFCCVEGAGGWYVPLNEREKLSDVVVQLQLPVIVVVGMKLGCLNHALLTFEAIAQAGLPIAGWVANCIDPNMYLLDENIESLQQMAAAPCLGIVPFMNTVDIGQAASGLSLPEIQ